MIDTVPETDSRAVRALMAVRVLHTAVWAFFVACILALPVAGWLRHFDWAAVLTGFIVLECGVLAVFRGRCPLTLIAARFTSDRSPAFDIFLPEWVAARNKLVFGTLFVVNEAVVLWQWRH